MMDRMNLFRRIWLVSKLCKCHVSVSELIGFVVGFVKISESECQQNTMAEYMAKSNTKKSSYRSHYDSIIGSPRRVAPTSVAVSWVAYELPGIFPARRSRILQYASEQKP